MYGEDILVTPTTSRRAKRQLEKLHQSHTSTSDQRVLRAIGYIRVSTEDQAETGSGLEYQQEAIESFAKSQGYQLLHIIQDEISGATDPINRPGFSSIAQMAMDKSFDVLLVWKFDRLSRHLVYAVQTVAKMQELDVTLKSVTEPIDTSSAMGQMIFSVLAGMASMERDNITQRTRAGRVKKAEKGGYAGGVAPLGYNRTEQGLQLNENEATVVRRIFELRNQSRPLRSIAQTLTIEGHRTKKGGTWHASTVAAILDNAKYKGCIEYVFGTLGKHILIPGQHTAIIK